MSSPLRLNLGAGNKILPGYLNHDRVVRPGIDIAWDMSSFPWPVEHLRGQMEHILASDVLEHIPPHLLVAVMDECWGLLMADGRMEIKVPVFGSHYHLSDLTHCHGFSEDSFDILDPETQLGAKSPWYTDRYWKIVSRKRDGKSLEQGSNLTFVLQKRS